MKRSRFAVAVASDHWARERRWIFLQGPHPRWSFVLDAFGCGRWFRIFVVVDDYSRACVRLIAVTSVFGTKGRRELDAMVFERMTRMYTIVSDNFLRREAALENGQKVSVRRM